MRDSSCRWTTTFSRIVERRKRRGETRQKQVTGSHKKLKGVNKKDSRKYERTGGRRDDVIVRWKLRKH